MFDQLSISSHHDHVQDTPDVDLTGQLPAGQFEVQIADLLHGHTLVF